MANAPQRKVVPPRKVIIVGSLNMDLIVRAPRRPAMGETVMGDTFDILPGGKGLNQAVAARRLGAPVEMVGCVGDDDFGRRFLAFLDAEDIGRTGVHATPEAATGVAVITLAGGDNAIVVAPGANMRLAAGDVGGLSFAPGDICVGQFEVPLATTEAAFRAARASGATTILNAAPAQALPPALLDAVDILVVNESELAAISGARVDAHSATADIAAAARPFATGPRVVVATLGARGAVVVDRNESREIPGRKVSVVDATGAGDCFIGALAAALAAGEDRDAALDRANAAAALSVQRLGGAPSMPTNAALRQAERCDRRPASPRVP